MAAAITMVITINMYVYIVIMGLERKGLSYDNEGSMPMLEKKKLAYLQSTISHVICPFLFNFSI